MEHVQLKLDNQKTAKAKAGAYETEAETDAYERGYDRGHSCASWQDLPDLGSTVWTEGEGKVKVDADTLWDVVTSLAYQGESNDRQFSPFEFTASEFNKAENEAGESLSDELWEAFDQGISDGIASCIAERAMAYGPIPEEEEEDSI